MQSTRRSPLKQHPPHCSFRFQKSFCMSGFMHSQLESGYKICLLIPAPKKWDIAGIHHARMLRVSLNLYICVCVYLYRYIYRSIHLCVYIYKYLSIYLANTKSKPEVKMGKTKCLLLNYNINFISIWKFKVRKLIQRMW